MPTVTRTNTNEGCPGCHTSKLVRVLERWDPFPGEDPVGYVEKMECSEHCGYSLTVRDDLGMIEVPTKKTNLVYA